MKPCLLHLLTAGIGTPRRFAAVRRFGRDRSEADMPRASGAGRSDENDPKQTLDRGSVAKSPIYSLIYSLTDLVMRG
jgi:hypothetical protein